jgi:uncharacterized membrane protein YgcG
MRTALVRGAAIMAGVCWFLAPAVAVADSPFEVTELVTDRVGALEGREDEVADAQRRLGEDYRLDLFVIYVDNFSGLSAQDWALEVAERSQLGINQALLAVATGERVYHLSVDEDYPLTDEQLAELRAIAITPALGDNDWAGAAIGAADGLGAILGGQPVQEPEIVPGDPEPGAGSDFPWVPVVVICAGAVVAGGYLYARSRRRSDEPAADPSTMAVDER